MATSNQIRVSAQYRSYNQRRYGRPWIGKIISWPVGGKADIEWGSYCGTDAGGEVEILSAPGEIIRHGQKDNRGNSTSSGWYVVQADGGLNECTAAEARKAWDELQAGTPQHPEDLSGVSDSALIDEITRRGLTL